MVLRKNNWFNYNRGLPEHCALCIIWTHSPIKKNEINRLKLFLSLWTKSPQIESKIKKRKISRSHKECYNLLSPGRRLTSPSLTKSFEIETGDECQQKCGSSEFECIAYRWFFSRTRKIWTILLQTYYLIEFTITSKPSTSSFALSHQRTTKISTNYSTAM